MKSTCHGSPPLAQRPRGMYITWIVNSASIGRRTACRYLERGGSLKTIPLKLGHSMVRSTERYGRLCPEVVDAELRKVGRECAVAGTVTNWGAGGP